MLEVDALVCGGQRWIFHPWSPSAAPGAIVPHFTRETTQEKAAGGESMEKEGKSTKTHHSCSYSTTPQFPRGDGGGIIPQSLPKIT